jgi:hypothetical protein
MIEIKAQASWPTAKHGSLTHRVQDNCTILRAYGAHYVSYMTPLDDTLMTTLSGRTPTVEVGYLKVPEGNIRVQQDRLRPNLIQSGRKRSAVAQRGHRSRNGLMRRKCLELAEADISATRQLTGLAGLCLVASKANSSP